MSVIKETIITINNLPFECVFNYTSISNIIYSKKWHEQNVYLTVDRYLGYLLDAKFIKINHMIPIDNAFATICGIPIYENYYIKEINIPDNLTVTLLKKLTTDENYRIKYMRKLKLKEIKHHLLSTL